MKKILMLLLLAASLIVCASCGGGGGSGGGSGYLGGTWAGTWVSTRGMGTGAIQVTLNQNGLVVTGRGFITDEGIKYNGSGSGTVTNETGPGEITLGLAFDSTGETSTFTGDYTASVITGRYADSSGDRGTFTLVKQ